MSAIVEWMKAGAPPHWAYVLCGVYVLDQVLAKVPAIRANNTLEAIFNFANRWLLKVPLVKIVAAVLDTPAEPAPVAIPAPLPPPPKAGEQ